MPLLGSIQLSNSAIAIATIQVLQQQGWNIPELAIQTGMTKARWLGRLQWVKYQDHPLLIDGANKPVNWIMGMMSTKDHRDILEVLLHPQDELHLVPVPDHSSADPQELADLGQQVCSQLHQCQTYDDLFVALNRVRQDTLEQERLVVLCGSLYLIGYFLRSWHPDDYN